MVIRQKYSYFLHVPTWLTGVYDYSLDQLLQRLRAGSMHAILQLLTGMRTLLFTSDSGVVGDRIVSGCPPLDILLNFEKQ